MRKVWVGCVPVAALAILLAVTATAQINKGKSRPLTTHTLMEKIVKPHHTAVSNGLKAEEVNWHHIAESVELLNESGHIMMADGRCPDKTWADACKTLQECSQVLLEKVEAEDLEGAQNALTALTGSCAACHKAHKSKKK